MRVAIESQSLTQVRTGVQFYLYHLLEGLSQLSTEDVFNAFYFSARTSDSLLPFANEVVTESNYRFPPGRILSGLWKYAKFPPVDCFVKQADVVHFPNFVTRPVSKKKKVVLTLHDLAFRRKPEWIEQKNLAFLN